MTEFIQSLIGQSEWSTFSGAWLPIGFKVCVSILCGGFIGLEREIKHKPAGLRTNILICLGAMLFTWLSVMMAGLAEPGKVGDPARVAAQIVTGIGFLGGGMILQSGGSVSGLTSAATVWVVAAIGMCIGLGYPIIAIIFTITVFITLYFLSKVDRKIFGKMHCYETWIHLKTMDPRRDHGDLPARRPRADPPLRRRARRALPDPRALFRLRSAPPPHPGLALERSSSGQDRRKSLLSAHGAV